MGRARFLLCMGFINRAAMGRAQFLLLASRFLHGVYFLFYLFFFEFLCHQTQTPTRRKVKSRNLSCLFAKSCWSINTRKMARILFSLMHVKCTFCVCWIRREYSPTLQLSLWRREYDRASFVINIFAILRVFRVSLGV